MNEISWNSIKQLLPMDICIKIANYDYNHRVKFKKNFFSLIFVILSKIETN